MLILILGEKEAERRRKIEEHGGHGAIRGTGVPARESTAIVKFNGL